MTFQNFSAGLIKTRDLDPDYLVMKAVVQEKGLNPNEVLGWIILKCFVYNTVAEYKILFEGKPLDGYTNYGQERVKNKRNTAKQMPKLTEGFKVPERVLDGAIWEYSDFKAHVTSFPGMGDWGAWKMADLLERVMGLPISFANVDFRTAYKFPLKGLCRVNGESDLYVSQLSDDLVYHSFMRACVLQLGPVNEMEAPGGRRVINIQEIETCLCKYHSFLGGHYRVGHDILSLMRRMEQNKINLPKSIKAEFEEIKSGLEGPIK